jgi:RNA polymerase sigma-70 factor (ECF subfamily)
MDASTETTLTRLGRKTRALDEGASSEELATAAKKGSPRAVELLVGRYWQRAYRSAFLVVGEAAEAEDVVQDSLIKALRSLRRFDEKRPFEPWFFRIVVNTAKDSLRRSERDARRDRAVAFEASRQSSQAPDDALARAILELPPDHRLVVVARFLLGYSTDEIAELAGIPRGTAGSRLRRALDSLKERMEQEGDDG